MNETIRPEGAAPTTERPRLARPAVAFSAPEEAARWRSVDDVVMGGASRGGLRPTGHGTCLFSGTLSLEGGGGFASVRTSGRELGLAGARALVLRFRGDGRTYQLRLRQDEAEDGSGYGAAFATEPGVWSEHAFEPADFRPVRRGRVMPGMPPLDLARVRGLGLLLADGRPGPFRLELASLRAL